MSNLQSKSSDHNKPLYHHYKRYYNDTEQPEECGGRQILRDLKGKEK